LVTLPNVSDLERVAPGNSIQVFDRYNQLVVTIDGDEEREFVSLKNVPKTVQQAIMAAEDHDFYTHHGISPKGIGRAFVSDVTAGKVVEGGSTLTQQLAKNLFFDVNDRSIVRKIREVFTALQIERHYNKNQIMEMYLNQVYFGRSAYGLERAARRYFGKTTAQLNLPESAFLMGLVKQPSYLGQPEHVDEAYERQHVVLDEMVELKFITPQQAAEAKSQRLAFNQSNTRITKFPYYMSAVQDFLQKNLDRKTLDKGGLRVYTNLDPVAQRLAEQTVARRVHAGGGGMNQAALVSVSVKDGGVLAIVGGAGNYWDHQWNAAMGAHTLGSSFKPFVYLTGFLQNKITPDTVVQDEPITIHIGQGMPDWTPKNFDNSYYGPLTIREALALSRNVCAVRVGMAAGIGHVMDTARSAGLRQAELTPTPAMFLGASAASPLEMAGAYATFARGGTYMPYSIVRRVESRDGFSKDYGTTYGEKVFPDYPVHELVSCMQSVVKEGTAVAAKLPDRPVAGKTGTTDSAKDLWFVGYTPDMVTAVWGGNDQHASLGNLTGGAVLTGIWKAYNVAYYKAHPTPPGSFYTDDVDGKKNDGNLLDKLFHDPADLLKSDEDKEKEAEQELNGPEAGRQDPMAPNAEREQEGAQGEQAGPEGPREGDENGPSPDRGDGSASSTPGNGVMNYFRLPGMPIRGHVRQPANFDGERFGSGDDNDGADAMPPQAPGPGFGWGPGPRPMGPPTRPVAPSDDAPQAQDRSGPSDRPALPDRPQAQERPQAMERPQPIERPQPAPAPERHAAPPPEQRDEMPPTAPDRNGPAAGGDSSADQ
jgi:1A family penicillin-binding protein